jgi:hypothetical protein
MPRPRTSPCSLEGVSTRLTVELVGDAQRAPDRHRTSAPQGEAAASVVFAVQQEAERAGWTREDAEGPLARDDVCPTCRITPVRSA